MSGDQDERPHDALETAALADRVRYSAAPEQWHALMQALDRQPRELPRLRRLMREPSVLERKN
ncbi:MAG TPA: DUF1778 domain-containing protein [Enhygromyxa sp.]|nr:DUF1778 domain-containing protein [Enhygromyxa sp.]